MHVLIWVGMAVLTSLTVCARPSQHLKKPPEWFLSAEGQKVLTNILSWQTPQGSWPKNMDTASRMYDGETPRPQGTYDNGATTDELRLLARAYNATNNPGYAAAFERGLRSIIHAQYPNGGWPQSYPPGKGYARYITFNDGSMVRLLNLLRDVATREDFRFVPKQTRDEAQQRFDRGIECILKCQVRKDGRLTVWCAQHDEVTLQPQKARSYELASLSGAESADILQLLMTIENPSPATRTAIEAGAAWYETSAIKGSKLIREGGAPRLVGDANASPMWARFYHLETGKPLFVDRDGLPRDSYNDLSAERRSGYAYVGNWGEDVARNYAKWKKRLQAGS